MTLYVVTVKVPGTLGHDPHRKQTGPCPTSDECTDRTGRHHSAVYTQGQLGRRHAARRHRPSARRPAPRGSVMARPPRPWRDVVGGWNGQDRPNWTTGRGSLVGGDTTRRARWWELRLSCGHEVERTVRYLPAEHAASRGGTQHRSGADVAPAPKRVRCEFCPTTPKE